MEKKTKPTGDPGGQYISIADCETCKHIPQKVSDDLDCADVSNIPQEIGMLSIVVEFDDPKTEEYCTSTTRLLKCPACGTYYYYNHYDDNGQHFMDPTFDEVTIRRYSPAATTRFLERVVGEPGGAMPRAMGQLVKAFAEGTTPEAPGIWVKGGKDGIDAAARELADLRDKYEIIIQGLAVDIQRKDLNWHTKKYALDALLSHYLARKDMNEVTRVLLNHEDPVVRVETAVYIWGVATDDAPVIDLVHVSRADIAALREVLAGKAYKKALVKVLADIAFSGGTYTTMQYDHGYGTSKYYETPVQIPALYGLIVAAKHVDLSSSIPAVVALIKENPRFKHHACWLLQTIVRKKLENARLVLVELDSFSGAKEIALLKDKEIMGLVKACRARLAKKK